MESQGEGRHRPLFLQKNIVLWSGAFLAVLLVSFQPEGMRLSVLNQSPAEAAGQRAEAARASDGSSPAAVPALARLGRHAIAPPARTQSLAQVYQWLRDYRTGLKPSQKRRLAEILYEESLRYGFEPAQIMALIATESSVFNWSRSHRGALGLMQLQPGTAQFVADRWADEEMEIASGGEELLFDPAVNLKLGVRYLAHLRNRFGDLRTALTAYNYGPTRVSAWLSECAPLPTDYADRILELSDEFRGRVMLASGPVSLSG